MKVASIAKVEFASNGVRVTLTDTTGSQRELDLSPRAEAQLMTALLSSSPAEIGRAQRRGPLLAENVRLYESKDGPVVLEASLGGRAAVHIALPKPLPERLRELLGQNPDTWRSTGLN